MKQYLKTQNILLFGFKKYNGTRCAVAEFKFNDLNLRTKIWLDAKKGTLLKTVNNGIDDIGEEYEIIEEYVATYNVVTDEDVKKPDLTGYTLIEINDEIHNVNPIEQPSITIDNHIIL